MPKQNNISSKPPLHENVGTRTPIRTFLRLFNAGDFSQIAWVTKRKLRTGYSLLTSAHAPHVRLLKRHPKIQRYLRRKHLKDVLHKYYGVIESQNSKDKLRVGLVVTSGNVRPRSSAFIRLISPLSSETVAQKISLSLFPENTTVAKDVDVCIVQRTAYDSVEIAQRLTESLRQANVKLVVDSDDGFHSIDQTHPEHDELQSRIDAFDYLLGQADAVWFSTPLLAKTHKYISHKIRVVPNSLDQRIWQRESVSKRSTTKNDNLRLVYMGTATHDSDLLLIMPALDELHKLYPGSFSLGVVGVSDTLPERSWMYPVAPNKGSIYPRFVEWFTSLEQFDFGLSPLVDSNFNRHKSDIKCLDYIAASIVPIVSDIEPYKSKDLDSFVIRTKNTTEDWLKTLRRLVLDTKKTRIENTKRIQSGQKYLWQKRNASDTGKVLYERLTSLVDKN